MVDDSHTGKFAVNLNSWMDDKDYILYTGKGGILKPPSDYDAKKMFINKNYTFYRLRAFTKGSGCVYVVISWWNNAGNRKYKYLGKYFLDNEYRQIHKFFTLPKTAKEFRVAFKLKKQKGSKVSLYLDDFLLERLL